KKEEEEKEEGETIMSEAEIERAKMLMDALRAMKLDVEETLRRISEGDKTVVISPTSVSPIQISSQSSTVTSSTPSSTTSIPSTPSSTPSTTTTRRPVSTTPKPTTTTVSPTATVTVPLPTTRIATVTVPTRKQATVTVSSAKTTTVTVPPTTVSTVTVPTTTVSASTVATAKAATVPVPPTTKTTVTIPTSTVKVEETTKTIDEVNTVDVKIDSDEGVEQAKVTPNNDSVLIVDNSAHIASHRLVGYTKSTSKVIDNNWTRDTKVYKKIPHDNSFLPSEEIELKPKILLKKRHLIQNDNKPAERKRIKKRVKKRMTSIPTPRIPSTTQSIPSTRPPPTVSNSVPSPTQHKVIVTRAVTQPQALIQVAPAAVQPSEQTPPVAARAAPIYRPIYPTLITQQPQYLHPQPLPQQIVQRLTQAQPYSQPLVQPLNQPYSQVYSHQPQSFSHPPIIRYQPIIVYQPIYGRKKREIEKKEEEGRHSILFNLKQKAMEIKKGFSSRFSR
ncbi:hypothetical protein PFISCL1PPCAC_5890, partial [Pristionchus fissidentatus]